MRCPQCGHENAVEMKFLRRMRHPPRSPVPGMWCPQCARSEVLRRVRRSPRVWRIVSSTPVAQHVHAETPRREDPHLQDGPRRRAQAGRATCSPRVKSRQLRRHPLGDLIAPVGLSASRCPVICDQTIVLAGIQTNQHYPEHLRRIRFKDPETGNTLPFARSEGAE
jgi:hypothetical protein